MNYMTEIYINGRFLTQPVTGVNRFALELCKALQLNNVQFKIIVPEWLEYDNLLKFDLVYSGKLKSHFWEQIDLASFLRKNNNPLLVNFSGLGPLFYKNQIITIHDLSFYANPNWFSFGYRTLYKIATPILAKKANAILTVSEFSKTEIIKFLGTNKDKITVIYNAVTNWNASKDSAGLEEISKKYILAVSSLDPRKNHKRLIEAFNNSLLEDYDLLLVGKSAKHFKLDFAVENNSRIKFLGYVDDLKLLKLYENAAVFVYPSLYEGFGIPPLEAMSNQCPVIVSDIPPHKEVCDKAAFYINPNDSVSIQEGLMKVLNDSQLRNTLIANGTERITHFDWNKSAEKVFDLIKKLN